MTTFNPNNERIKRTYFERLTEAKGKSPKTLYKVRKSLVWFEKYTNYQDFHSFKKEQAIGFKEFLLNQKRTARSKDLISRASTYYALSTLKAFFKWMKAEYKSAHFTLGDVEYFNLPGNEIRAAKSERFRSFPSLEEISKVVNTMPSSTDIEKRDRALLAFAILTGTRADALISLRIKHVSLKDKMIIQDPKEVRTKYRKIIHTWFFPIGQNFEDIAKEWVRYLIEVESFEPNDPLFPKTHTGIGSNGELGIIGLSKEFWESTNPLRAIYRRAFEAVKLEYHHPHSFRRTLTQLGERICKTPEHFKAWSQNLGHEHVSTTFTSYGSVSPIRQGLIITEELNKAA